MLKREVTLPKSVCGTRLVRRSWCGCGLYLRMRTWSPERRSRGWREVRVLGGKWRCSSRCDIMSSSSS